MSIGKNKVESMLASSIKFTVNPAPSACNPGNPSRPQGWAPDTLLQPLTVRLGREVKFYSVCILRI